MDKKRLDLRKQLTIESKVRKMEANLHKVSRKDLEEKLSIMYRKALVVEQYMLELKEIIKQAKDQNNASK